MRLENCYSGSFVGKKMNSYQATRRLVPSPFFFDFQLSPPSFNFFNLTPGVCQLDPYSLAPFADWPLALYFVNLTPNWPQNFNLLAI
jgi:hypothetical protein